MLKFTDYDIVFQEVPDEVSLALNLSRCPNNCVGCHSPQLRDDIGEELTEDALLQLLEKYGSSITCVCFMGGDGDPHEVARLARFVRNEKQLKTAWYSGRDKLVDVSLIPSFDYIKIGPYIPEKGPLKDENTNQRLYKIVNGEMQDITSRFWRKNSSLG